MGSSGQAVMEAGIAGKHSTEGFRLQKLFNLKALEEFELPKDSFAEGDAAEGSAGISSDEASSSSDGGTSGKESKQKVAGMRMRRNLETERSFSDEVRAEESAGLVEQERRGRKGQLQRGNPKVSVAAIAAGSGPGQVQPAATPLQVSNGRGGSDFSNRVKQPGGVSLAAQPWSASSPHALGMMEGRIMDAAQRRRMRKAKQRVKEAEALRRQGDPEAARALQAAHADLLAASASPQIPIVMRVPSPSVVTASPTSSPVVHHSSVDNDSFIDLGKGIKFSIPPFYDQLAQELHLPDLKEVEVDERLLDSNLSEVDILTLIKLHGGKGRDRLLIVSQNESVLEKSQVQRSSHPSRKPEPALHLVSEPPIEEQQVGASTQAKSEGATVRQYAEPFSEHHHAPSHSATAHRQRAVEGQDWVLALPAVSQQYSDDDVPDSRRSRAIQTNDLSIKTSVLRAEDAGFTATATPSLVVNAEPSPVSPMPSLPSATPPAISAPMPFPLPDFKISQAQLREAMALDEPLLYEQQQQQLHLLKRLLKKEQKPDPLAVMREEAEKVSRSWVNMVRRDLPRWQRQFVLYHRKQTQECKRTAELCQREVRARTIRSIKSARQAPMRIKRLARDMVIFWKKVDKEQAEQRKREEREALDARRREEEMREARRQQQRLNFLLTQTELYSHFMQTKLGAGKPEEASAAALEEAVEEAKIAGVVGIVEESDVKISDEEKAEIAALKEEALRAAEAAASEQQQRTNAFDDESTRLRRSNEGENAASPEGVPEGAKDMDLLHPSTMPAASSVSQPEMFKGRLKEYQLKGLQWLVNLYEQGLNGILADEMGLGKTIQAMSFLAHLAEEKNIWGPFLVVAPASVLSNWADEIARFLPNFRVLPYWGGLQERTILRKNINPKRLYKRDAAFHALITSYQLMVSDEKYFRRVKWQYMVLDEAQAIKSSSSLRWKTLLSFNCRNRLLLTGTPIQNSMAELWALLHFIMPTLFDSHEQFNEWFSKGIEGHAEHGGTLNEHQLSRLHSILKPFMLRRVKRDVESEMTGKKELTVACALSSRQKMLYDAIKHKISVADLFDSGQLNEKKVLHLMNIVIQLRKVCNHPELFERNEGSTFFHFAAVPHSLAPPPFGELEDVYYAGNRNLITYEIPKLVFRDCMRSLSSELSGSAQGFESKWLHNRLSLLSSDYLYRFLWLIDNGHQTHTSFVQPNRSGSLGFLHLFGLSVGELSTLSRATFLERWLLHLLHRREPSVLNDIEEMDRAKEGVLPEKEPIVYLADESEDGRYRCVRNMLIVPSRGQKGLLRQKKPTGKFLGGQGRVYESLVQELAERMIDHISLLRATWGFIPPVRAAPVEFSCPDRGFAYQQQQILQSPLVKRLLLGWARGLEEERFGRPVRGDVLIEELQSREEMHPLLSVPFRVFGGGPPMQIFDFARMLTDSGKLHKLDQLLRQLRSGGHRVLVFAQMTKMLNILEDYMKYRRYKYLRLDGSSSITDRRDMVKDFQQRADIFVFLLSTRAGGLGINLTAADTVIFYESDWNPTMDLQAMDRAHRLGQTREVTVYRMICQGTVEEKIVKRANQKNTVQQLVMTGGQAQADVFDAEEVVSLLLDDAELERQMELARVKQLGQERGKKKRGAGFLGTSKGIRLDAEGGAAVIGDAPAPLPASIESTIPAENINGDGGGGGPEAQGAAGVKRSRKRKGREGEEKPPKAPKAPRVRKPQVRAPRNRKSGEGGGGGGRRKGGKVVEESPGDDPSQATPLDLGSRPTSTGQSGMGGSDTLPHGAPSDPFENGASSPLREGAKKGKSRQSSGRKQMQEERMAPSKPRRQSKESGKGRGGGEKAFVAAVNIGDSRESGREEETWEGVEGVERDPAGKVEASTEHEGSEKRNGSGSGAVGRPRSRLPKKAKMHGPAYGGKSTEQSWDFSERESVNGSDGRAR